MPRFNTEEQFKFLISCIRYSNNGRIDFVEVAKECNVVSKGAAAKRYERMMKAHSIGVDMNATDGSTSEAATPKKKRKRAQPDTSENNEEHGNHANIKTEGDAHEANSEDYLNENAYAESNDFGMNMKFENADGTDNEEAIGPESKKPFIKREPSFDYED